MHPYATDSTERQHILLALATLSIIAAWLLSATLTAYQLTVPWWIDAPSVVGFYSLLYALFNHILWRFPLLRRLHMINVPDLSGDWRGSISSSFDEHSEKLPVLLKITQTWTHIAIHLKADSSQSHSFTATISVRNGSPTLSYLYLNEPKANAHEHMHAHRGTAWVILLDDHKLEGEYYSGRDRQNYGTITVKRC